MLKKPMKPHGLCATTPEDLLNAMKIESLNALKGYDHFYAQIPEKPSPDIRLQTAMNAMGDALYAIEAGDAQHAVTILRDTLTRLNQQ